MLPCIFLLIIISIYSYSTLPRYSNTPHARWGRTGATTGGTPRAGCRTPGSCSCPRRATGWRSSCPRTRATTRASSHTSSCSGVYHVPWELSAIVCVHCWRIFDNYCLIINHLWQKFITMASWLEFCEAESLRVSRLLGGSPHSNYSTNVWSLTNFLRNSLITLRPFAGTRTAPNDVRLMVYVVLNLVLFGFQPNIFLGFSSCKNTCIVSNLFKWNGGWEW